MYDFVFLVEIFFQVIKDALRPYFSNSYISKEKILIIKWFKLL